MFWIWSLKEPKPLTVAGALIKFRLLAPLFGKVMFTVISCSWNRTSNKYLVSASHTCRGLYIGKYPLPLGGGKISADIIWGKNMKWQKEKGRNLKEKGRKGKEKGRKRKGNKKRGSKRVK